MCEFYKAGQCAKGFKCKFSHDLNVQRKGEKIDIYTDKRDQGTGSKFDSDNYLLLIVLALMTFHFFLTFDWLSLCQKQWRIGIKRPWRR